MKRPLLGLALAAGVLAFAAPAVAQADPIVVAPIAYAPAPFIGQHELRGTVTYFNAFTMRVRADGRDVPVRLHQGTIINPTGLTLHAGMYVRVFGFWENGRFHADRIGLIR